jgi:hypothetical protein
MSEQTKIAVERVDSAELGEYPEKPEQPGSRVAEFDPTPYMRQIRGRGGSQTDYLDVRHRLLWLRREHPNAEIVTEVIHIDDKSAVFKAMVILPEGGKATGHGSETAADFSDYIEKAETKALGRALNALGYGAQFAESDEPVKTPQPARKPAPPARREPPRPSTGTATPLADYSWTAFWEWARGQGYANKEALERAIGKPIAGMNPAEIRALLKPQSGA